MDERVDDSVVTEITQQSVGSTSQAAQGNRHVIGEAGNFTSSVENLAPTSSILPQTSLLGAGTLRVSDTGGTDLRTELTEVHESLDQIELFVDEADVEMQSSLTRVPSIARPVDEPATKAKTPGSAFVGVKHSHQDDSEGDLDILLPERHSEIGRSEARGHRNRSRDHRDERRGDRDSRHSRHHHHHRRQRTLSWSPPQENEEMRSWKGGYRPDHTEMHSPGEPSERGWSGGHRKKFFARGTEEDCRSGKSIRSRMYSDDLEVASEVTRSNDYHHYHHHYHHHKHRHEKDKRKWKRERKHDKAVRKKKQIEDSSMSSCVESEDDYHHHHKHRHEKESKNSKREKEKKTQIAGSSRRGKSLNLDLVTRDDLLKETHAIEEEIRSNKRAILKSSLRKERIELLHKNMHGTSLGSGGGGRGEGGGGAAGASSDEELQAKLVELDREILSGKQQLLMVMKRMEQNSDSN